MLSQTKYEKGRKVTITLYRGILKDIPTKKSVLFSVVALSLLNLVTRTCGTNVELHIRQYFESNVELNIKSLARLI